MSTKSKLLFVALCIIFSTHTLASSSSCESAIRNSNIVTTSLLTVANSWIKHGRQFTMRDAGRALLYGSASGYGFYQAKRQAGNGNVQTGIALAYATSSVLNNVINKEHPLAYFRYGIGPIEATFATPWAINQGNKLTIDVDALEMASMVTHAGDVDRWAYRDGIVYGVSEKNTLSSEDVPQVYAQTNGKHVLFNKDYMEQVDVWQHEAVHVIQNIQFQSFMRFRGSDVVNRLKNQPAFPVTQDAVEMDVSFSWFHLPMSMASEGNAYSERWDEIEAAQLGEGHAPYGGDDEDCGGIGLSFVFNF